MQNLAKKMEKKKKTSLGSSVNSTQGRGKIITELKAMLKEITQTETQSDKKEKQQTRGDHPRTIEHYQIYGYLEPQQENWEEGIFK